MNSFRILIVEDEVLIADNIARYLTRKGHDVVGIAISYEEAEELYLREKPDMSLLDIKLNGSKTGIDVGHFIQKSEHPSPFIYLTSQIDPRNINAAKATFPAGYLSKPIQKESLFATIEIVMYKITAEQAETLSISLYDGKKNHVVSVNDILYMESDHIYLNVYLDDNQVIIQRNTLNNLLSQLPLKQFIQTHRGFAVNINKVNRWDADAVYIEENVIPISRSRRKNVHAYLKEA